MPSLPLAPLGDTGDLHYWIATAGDQELIAGPESPDGWVSVTCRADQVITSARAEGFTVVRRIAVDKERTLVIFRRRKK